MKKDLPEKLKPIAESWKPGDSTILYAELEEDGLTTLILGSKNSIEATLYCLISKIAEHFEMYFSDLQGKMADIDMLRGIIGDEDETEENH